jgi:hypothetical protein
MSSLILTQDECISLASMTQALDGTLLYRASRDSFTASAFHSKCNHKENTITIIKNNLNCVFGGCAFQGSHSSDGWSEDSNAFIFSLRRLGVSDSLVFMVKDAKHAVFGRSDLGPTFGNGYDICIKDYSNIQTGSFTNLCYSYKCPPVYTTRNDDTKSFLAGNYNNWLTTEIEVYQIIV